MIELKKLVDAFNNGDAEAFRKIFDLLYSHVANFVNQQIDDRSSAQDIAAEIFITVWLKRKHFETFEKLRAFIFVSARNACCDYIKNQSKLSNRKRAFIYLSEQAQEDLYTMPDPDVKQRETIQNDVYEYILKEIELLPEQCRRIFKMSFFNNAKNKDIANTLKISEKTVRNQKVLAIKMLRSSFRHQCIAVSLFLLF